MLPSKRVGGVKNEFKFRPPVSRNAELQPSVEHPNGEFVPLCRPRPQKGLAECVQLAKGGAHVAEQQLIGCPTVPQEAEAHCDPVELACSEDVERIGTKAVQ
jgi:hypothetical protein